MKLFAVALLGLVLGLTSAVPASATEPTPPMASVLGVDLSIWDASDLREVVLNDLFFRYAEAQAIQATPAEVDAYIAALRRAREAEGRTEEPASSSDEATAVDDLERALAYGAIRQWKVDKALYERYGGRIAYQQFGPEPADAYRMFLEESERNGDFAIYIQNLADRFWRYFTDDSRHDFMPPGSAEEAEAFSVPPWAK